jgi:hypothetical protein
MLRSRSPTVSVTNYPLFYGKKTYREESSTCSSNFLMTCNEQKIYAYKFSVVSRTSFTELYTRFPAIDRSSVDSEQIKSCCNLMRMQYGKIKIRLCLSHSLSLIHLDCKIIKKASLLNELRTETNFEFISKSISNEYFVSPDFVG